MAFRHFRLLKLVHVRFVLSVALFTEGEVVALSAVEVELVFFDRLGAAIASKPHFVALACHLLSCVLHSSLFERLGELLLIGSLILLAIVAFI